jgi:hypothetical protein
MAQTPFVHVGRLGREHALDVHWRVANPQRLAELPGYDELASRARTITVRAQAMKTPCPVDALLLACVHRAAHHNLSDDLIWIYDIHLLAQSFTDTEWRRFVTLAAKYEVRALCLNGLETASSCFHTPVPRDVISQLDVATEVPERSAVYLRKDLTQLDHVLADLGPLAPRARMQLVFEHLFPPAQYIREKYGVRRGSLLPFLYVRRAVKGIGRWLPRRP